MSKGRYAPPPAAPAADDLLTRPGVVLLEYRHDPDCPAQRSQSLTDCRCEPETWLVRPFDTPPSEVQIDANEVLL